MVYMRVDAITVLSTNDTHESLYAIMHLWKVPCAQCSVLVTLP